MNWEMQAARRIWKDLADRSGIGNALDETDKYTKKAIIADIAGIIKEECGKAK